MPDPAPRVGFSEDLHSMSPGLGLSQEKQGSRSSKALGHRIVTEMELLPARCVPGAPGSQPSFSYLPPAHVPSWGWQLPPATRQTSHAAPCPEAHGMG